MLRIKRNWQIGFLFAALIGLGYSCNQDYPDLIKNDKENDISVAGRAPKILYVMVTGARGHAVKQAVDNDRLPALKDMEKHAIYTYDGIADYKNSFDTMTVANGWMNMLTGVAQDKSQADHQYVADMKLNKYPSFITRLKERKPDLGTSVFTSADLLKDSILTDADVAESFHGDDNATVGATMNALAEDDSTSVFLTQLSGVEEEGEATNFDSANASYIDAIVEAGKQVDKLVQAVKDRENYEGENWLIIIASGKGGGAVEAKDINETNYDDALRNSFILFYNKDFQQYFAPKPRTISGAGYYQGKTVYLTGDPSSNGVNAVVQASDQKAYDPATTGSLTVECKVRFFPHDGDDFNYGNTPFISKGLRTGSTPGWVLWRGGDNIHIFVGDGNTNMQDGGGNVADDKWHTLAYVMWNDGGTERVKLFIDNQVVVQQQTQMSGIKSDESLTFGFQKYLFGSPAINMYMTDVRVWDTHLPDDVIKEYSCLPGMPPSTHPYINDLVGFWSGRDGSGNVYKDAVNGNDAEIITGGTGSGDWESFKDISDAVCPDPAPFYYEKVPNTVDIPFEIFNWLSIDVPDSWDLDGKAWLTGYTDVRNPIN